MAEAITVKNNNSKQAEKGRKKQQEDDRSVFKMSEIIPIKPPVIAREKESGSSPPL